jgi:sugar phosphate isomerase/epimerase
MSLDQAAQVAAEAGFCRVELSIWPEHLGDWWLQPERTRERLATYGLVADSVHSPETAWDNNAIAEPARLASVAAAREAIWAAAAVGARLVVVHPNRSGQQGSGGADPQATERTRASLADLATTADDAGVRLALENMPARTADRPGVRVAELLAMIAGLGDHLGVLLDVGHCNISGTDPCAEARLAGNKLLAMHLQDNEGLPGQDQHLFPGMGTIDWDRLLDTLDEIGYGGLRTFEVGAGASQPELVTMLGALRQTWRARKGGIEV